MKPHPIYTKAVAAAASSGKPAFADVSLTDTAKLIRATLKAKFPGVKFSVRSSRYAGGSSIDVRWNDGPGQSAVQDVIAPYASQGFDGMIDMAYCKGGWLYPDGSAGFRSSQGGQCSGGTAPAYKLPAGSADAIPARFGPSYVSAQRGKSVAYVADELRAYAAAHADKLADAIRAGTVKAAGDDGYAYADGAQSIMVDEVGMIWGDSALHRFDCARLAAAGSAPAEPAKGHEGQGTPKAKGHEGTADTERGMNSYELKQERRRERLEAAADHADREANARIGRARDMASVIPFGQPILVGHHSEKRDRNYRARIDSNFRQGFEASKRAGDLRARAAAVGTGGISSDDPDAPDKLRERIEELEAKQAHMKAVNKALRKDDDAALADMGLSPGAIAKLKEPDFAGRAGYPDYALTNNSANLRRLKKRLAHLERHADDETTRETVGAVEIVDNVEANRVQIIFPGKPDEGIRRQLKASGFRWARSEGAWQRHRSDWAIHQARTIVASLPQ